MYLFSGLQGHSVYALSGKYMWIFSKTDVSISSLMVLMLFLLLLLLLQELNPNHSRFLIMLLTFYVVFLKSVKCHDKTLKQGHNYVTWSPTE